ncbi:MAG TPA: outer membrane lipoprotein-sorting protein [Terracidiphilus sp.]|nr:outer membrane lipoprotein-sorting protein [Terracidiphilus sp.]
MRLPAAAVLAVLLSAGAALAPAFAMDAHGALDQARLAVRKADFRASGHLVRVDPSGARSSYPIIVKAHWFPGVLRVFVELAPASDSAASRSQALHALLELRPGGASSIRIAHPGDAAPTVLPVDKWSDGVASTGFSYEDFLEGQLFWAGQSVTEHVKYGARDCDLVMSTPGPVDKSHYAEVRTWLDRGIAFSVYVEKTVKASSTVKQYTYFGLRREGGVWSASQIEEKNHGQPGSTLLIIDRGSAKANLGPADFNPERLTHF